MQITLDCLPCIYRQALEMSRMATGEEKIIREILNEFARMIPEIDNTTKAPVITIKIQDLIAEKTGVIDPYRDYKQKHIELAESFMPEMNKIINKAEDPLLWALIGSALGNTIDAGASLDVPLQTAIKDAVQNSLVRSDYDKFRKELKSADDLLFIADNAGEAVFDKLLLKQLKEFVHITYAVRERPVLNDITLQEAKELKINEYADLISSGSIASGTIMAKTSEKFQHLFHSADIRLSKGQGNLEGLYEEKEDIFFLLTAKCEPVANMLDVKVRDLVFILNE